MSFMISKMSQQKEWKEKQSCVFLVHIFVPEKAAHQEYYVHE